jgi:hypothetical protein
MNSFLYSRCYLVSRRVRHAQIEHRSAKVVSAADGMTFTGPRAYIPVVVFGQFFCLGQGRLYLRRKELGSSDGI